MTPIKGIKGSESVALARGRLQSANCRETYSFVCVEIKSICPSKEPTKRVQRQATEQKTCAT